MWTDIDQPSLKNFFTSRHIIISHKKGVTELNSDQKGFEIEGKYMGFTGERSIQPCFLSLDKDLRKRGCSKTRYGQTLSTQKNTDRDNTCSPEITEKMSS